jgi:hypothetical protein
LCAHVRRRAAFQNLIAVGIKARPLHTVAVRVPIPDEADPAAMDRSRHPPFLIAQFPTIESLQPTSPVYAHGFHDRCLKLFDAITIGIGVAEPSATLCSGHSMNKQPSTAGP